MFIYVHGRQVHTIPLYFQFRVPSLPQGQQGFRQGLF